MNAIRDSHAAYASATHAVKTPRGTEYDAFARATQRMKTAQDHGANGFADLADAVLTNRKLWTLLAVDISDRDNALPRDLRARIMYLADFTREHSRLVLQRKASADALIDINRAMMAGLRNTAMQSRRTGT